MPARVWIVGEGNNELGVGDGYGGRHRGVLEALLARVCDDGWECAGKQQWNAVQKFQAGGARLTAHSHGLVLEAYENAADAVAFTRDVDSDPDREDSMIAALAWIRDESGWLINVIGGVAKPAIEGWILALRAIAGTDEMSRRRAMAHLSDHGIGIKSTADYVDVVERAELGAPRQFGLPAGAESLRVWLATAHEVLTRLVRGWPAP